MNARMIAVMKRFTVWRYLITTLLGLSTLFGWVGTTCAQPPAWMMASPQTTDDPQKSVWLLVAEPGAAKQLASLDVLQAPVYIETSEGRRYLYDFQTFLRKDGMNFRFGRNEIAAVHYCTVSEGAPASMGYGPRLVLRNGDTVEKDLGEVRPSGWLKPSLLRFEKKEFVEVYGQRRERMVGASLARPVLAFAWSRADAERARDEIILNAARRELNHVFLKWGQQQRIHVPGGPVEVKTEGEQRWGTINNRGDAGDWGWGRLTITAGGREHRFEEWKFFTKPFSVKDPSGTFKRLNVDVGGVHFYYPTGARFDSVRDVDTSLLTSSCNTSE